MEISNAGSLKNERIWTLSTIVSCTLAVTLFLFAIDLLGTGLGQLAGERIAPIIEATANPFIGLFIGLLITAIIQSSSTTTSIAVAAVASGSITFENTLPIILGANIGTTITSTIVAFGYITKEKEFRRAVSGAMIHDMFNILGVLLIFPLEINYHFLQRSSAALAALMPIGTSSGPSGFWISHVFESVAHMMLQGLGPILLLLVSVFMLFGSLKIVSNVLYKQLVGKRQKQFRNVIFKNSPRAFGWGLALTSMVQSSSLTSSLIVPLVATGKVRLPRAFQFLMGANIGTTITAILAALFRSEAAMSLAIAHFMFNTLVVVIFVSVPFLGRLPLYLAEKLGALMNRYRVAAIVYITLAFFAIPFALIYFNRDNTLDIADHQPNEKIETGNP